MGKPTDAVHGVLRLKTLFRHPKTAAVLLAGGSGTRMGTETTKQMLPLRGKPVILHTLQAFQACRLIDEIVVVTRPEERLAVTRLCQTWGIDKCHALVLGGETRQASAERGLEALSADIAYIAIHDVARCLITPTQIARVLTWAYAYHAATAATPVVDTVKTVNAFGFITSTLPRETVWLAATPQAFHLPYYRAAVRYAQEKGLRVTDDNSLMEAIGQRVKIVDTGCENFKITHPEDLIRAEAVLKAREERSGGK